MAPAVASRADYVAAHQAMIDFLKHAVHYVETHGDELELFGVSLRFVYIRVVLGVAGGQVVTLILALIRSF